jgi:hypothetical protein
MLKMLAKDKHSSLFGPFVISEEKIFISLTTELAGYKRPDQ